MSDPFGYCSLKFPDLYTVVAYGFSWGSRVYDRNEDERMDPIMQDETG